MMEHDPLCPSVDGLTAPFPFPICICDILVIVRDDERERIARAIEAYGGALSAAQWQRVAARIARGES